MTKKILILCLTIWTSPSFAQLNNFPEPEKINDELTFQQLNEKTYMITHYFPWGANSLVVQVNGENVVLIDTPYDGAATETLLKWIREKFGEVKISAIVTGFHQDNLGGNEVLILQGIPVYGMSLTAELVRNEGDDLMEEIFKSVEGNENRIYLARYQDLHLTAPDNTFDLSPGQSRKIEIAGETFDFYFPGESHTVDNTVVYLPEQKLLFGGCMIRAFSDQRPGYIKYANMEAWPVSVQKVLNRYPEVEVVIPGHGKPGDKSLLPHTIHILDQWNLEH